MFLAMFMYFVRSVCIYINKKHIARSDWLSFFFFLILFSFWGYRGKIKKVSSF